MPSGRRIALLARDLVWEDTSGGSLPFSYAATKLQASIESAPDLGDVETEVIDLQSADPEAFMERIRELRPSVVAASSYIWSVETFCKLAEKVHRWDPSVRFVMGGPAARPSVLDLPPYAPYARYVDGLVEGEGEEAIRQIVRAPDEDGWARSIPGMRVPTGLGWRLTSPAERPPIDEYASPYHLGIVPRGGIGYLESFRGCPMRCAFCQWGDTSSDRVHSVPYLTAHLQGLKDSAVDKVNVVDAAFNLSPRAFANLAEAEREVGALRHTEVMGNLYPTILREEHLELLDGFGRTEINLGLQSVDPQVLNELGRPFDVERFERVLAEVRSRYTVSLEIILGLPGDNPASFRRTLDRTIELADKVRVFYCLALPDAMLERADEFGIAFDPVTFEVHGCNGWTAEQMHAEWDRVCELTRSMYRPTVGPNWTEFHSREDPASARAARAREQEPGPVPAAIPERQRERLRRAVDTAAMGWELSGARFDGEHLLLDLHGAAGSLVLEVARSSAEQPSLSEHDGIAYSYRGSSLGDPARLQELIARVHRDVGSDLPELLARGDDAA